jgi:hypothetical protein
MSSEATLEVAQMVGNTDLWQRGSGHSAVSWAQHAPRHRAGIVRAGSETRGRVNHVSEGRMCAST